MSKRIKLSINKAKLSIINTLFVVSRITIIT